MPNFEIGHFDGFESVKIFVNQTLIFEQKNCSSVTVNIEKFPADVSIEFFPMKIKPIIRFDSFMLDYWLADVLLYDHKLEMLISEDFYSKYKERDIKGRIDALPLNQKTGDYFDKYVGVNNAYSDIVNQIQEIIYK